MQAVAFPLEDGLALHENMRFLFPDTLSRQRIVKQGSVKIDLFPPPKGTMHITLYLIIFSVMLSLLSGHTTVGVMNRRHIWGTRITHIKNIFHFSERCTVSFKIQQYCGLGINCISLLFQLMLKAGCLAHSHQGLQSLCVSSAQVTSLSSFYPRVI